MSELTEIQTSQEVNDALAELIAAGARFVDASPAAAQVDVSFHAAFERGDAQLRVELTLTSGRAEVVAVWPGQAGFPKSLFLAIPREPPFQRKP